MKTATAIILEALHASFDFYYRINIIDLLYVIIPFDGEARGSERLSNLPKAYSS